MLLPNSARLKKFQKSLKEGGVIIDHPIDLFYLTGLKLSLGRLIVTALDARLFVDGRYLESAQKNKIVKAELLSKEALQAFAAKIPYLSFDGATTSAMQMELLKKLFPKKLKMVSHPLQKLRAIKDKMEMGALCKSAKLLWKGFEMICSLLKEGVTEESLALEFELYVRRQGASGLSFDPIIAFGENSAMPHYRAGRRKLKKGDIVLIDIGVVVDEYASDMTRVVHFGEIDPRLKVLHKVVLAAHAAALSLCRPGVAIGKLDQAAREEMKRAHVEHLYVHSLGHGIGLETHEFPKVRFKGEDQEVVLQEGMAITIEPGLYLPGVGGVRHEDTLIITSNGYKNLYSPRRSLTDAD